MANALLDTVSVDIEAGNCVFRASGHSIKFDGFTVLYEEAKDSASEEEKENKILPPIEEGQLLRVKGLEGNQHFTCLRQDILRRLL